MHSDAQSLAEAMVRHFGMAEGLSLADRYAAEGEESPVDVATAGHDQVGTNSPDWGPATALNGGRPYSM